MALWHWAWAPLGFSLTDNKSSRAQLLQPIFSNYVQDQVKDRTPFLWRLERSGVDNFGIGGRLGTLVLAGTGLDLGIARTRSQLNLPIKAVVTGRVVGSLERFWDYFSLKTFGASRKGPSPGPSPSLSPTLSSCLIQFQAGKWLSTLVNELLKNNEPCRKSEVPIPTNISSFN